MNILQLAKEIYNNHDNKQICFSIDGIDTQKDLFFFCNDLFFIILNFYVGDDNNTIDIYDITQNIFDDIKFKLSLANIIVNIEISDCENDMLFHNILDIEKDYCYKKLNDYKFTLKICGKSYNIFYEIKKTNFL